MFQPSKELITLKGFFDGLPTGAYITYEEIEKETGIAMDTRGKGTMRTALKSLKLEYRSDVGKGIELECPANAMQLVTNKVKRSSNSLTSAGKTTAHLTEKYIHQLPSVDRDRLLATASLFGAIQAMAKGLSSIYKPKKLKIIPPQSASSTKT